MLANPGILGTVPLLPILCIHRIVKILGDPRGLIWSLFFILQIRRVTGGGGDSAHSQEAIGHCGTQRTQNPSSTGSWKSGERSAGGTTDHCGVTLYLPALHYTACSLTKGGGRRVLRTLCVGSSASKWVTGSCFSRFGRGRKSWVEEEVHCSCPPFPPDRQSGPFTGSCWQRPASGGFLSAEITMRSR